MPRLLAAVEAPLTLDRFLSNIRDAWAFSRLRIPGNPADAKRELCGEV